MIKLAIKIKGIVYGRYRGSKKYKLNYIHVNYNDKTGFCYKNNTIGVSSLELYEKEKQKHENVNHWKCEKCNNFFSRFRQLKQYKEEHTHTSKFHDSKTTSPQYYHLFSWFCG